MKSPIGNGKELTASNPKSQYVELKIGSVLSALIKERRLTLREVSKETGISISTLSDWQANRKPDPVKAAILAKYLEITLHNLLFGTEDDQEPLQKVLKEQVFSGVFEITLKRVRIPGGKSNGGQS